MTKTQIAKLQRLKEDRIGRLRSEHKPVMALMYEMVLTDILEALTPDLSNMEFTADPEIHTQD